MADIAIINPVLALEAAGNSGSTHKAVLKASDLVTSGNTETLTIPINAAATDIKQVEVVCLRLITPFEDKSDATNVSLTVECGWAAGSATGANGGLISGNYTHGAAMGDADTNGFLRATEVSANGAFVMFQHGTGVRGQFNVAAKHIDVLCTCTSGDNTADIDKGELEIWVRILGAQD